MDAPVFTTMNELWEQGVCEYTPTVPGIELDVENGTPEASLHNLRKIRELRRVEGFYIGPRQQVLVTFIPDGSYLATGFGTHGLKGKAFAVFLEECGLGERHELYRYLIGTPEEFTGKLQFVNGEVLDPLE